jgi:uncharacterized integral membrane protein (TIGR00697 family)
VVNEVIFFLHIIIVIFIAFGALKIGKEALIALTALLAVAANFFVLKQMVLFGWNVTCSDVFAVGSILSLNLLQEHFGKETARRAVWICFFAMIFFGLMSQIHLLYTPSSFDYVHAHYLALLSPAPRLLIASLVSFFFVQQIDVALFSLLKKRFGSIDWRWRNGASLFVSQLLDTVLFSILGLYGLVASLESIIVVSFLVKLVIIASIASLASLSKRMMHYEI